MTVTKDHIFTCQVWHLPNELGVSTQSDPQVGYDQIGQMTFTELVTPLCKYLWFSSKDIFSNMHLMLRPYDPMISESRAMVGLASYKGLISSLPQS